MEKLNRKFKGKLPSAGKLLAAGIVAGSFLLGSSALAAPDTDNRIKTLIYNENDVYRVVARSGFQTNIELAPDETIDTLSIGDSIGWQVTPATKRIFVKPLQKNGVTNLSVITNKRSYQFELIAVGSSANASEQAYVVKFYYPEDMSVNVPVDRSRGSLRPVSPTAIPELPTAQAPIVPPSLPGQFTADPVSSFDATDTSGHNFNYSLTRPETLAPTKIYDDGKSTFFQFREGQVVPTVSVVLSNGQEIPVAVRPDSASGRVIVDQVAAKFTIRTATDLVCVFNEKVSAPPIPAGRPY